MRTFRRYMARALFHDHDLLCDVGFQLSEVDKSTYGSILRISGDGFPAVFVALEAQPGAVARETTVAAMKKIALNEEWEAFNLDSPTDWANVRRAKSLAALLPEEDRVAVVKHFFVESIRQLRDELTAFKKEHPDLPWSGGEVLR